MEKKFAIPVSMECTKEQMLELGEELKKLGYNVLEVVEPDSHSLLVNNYNAWNGNVSNTFIDNRNTQKRYFIDHYNPELFIALATQCEGERFYEHEWVVPTDLSCNNYASYTVGKLYQLDKRGERTQDFYTKKDNRGIADNGCSFYKFRKATREEIIDHFTNKKPMEEKKIKEYNLIKEYPGSPKMPFKAKRLEGMHNNFYWQLEGRGSSATHSYFLPEFWQPVYEEEFKAGDYVFGWFNTLTKYHSVAWQIGHLSSNTLSNERTTYAHPKGESSANVNIKHLRKATSEEIEKYKASQEVILRLGTNNLEIKIKEGKISTRVGEISLDSLRRLEGRMGSLQTEHLIATNFVVGNYITCICPEVQCIRIGCKTENHLFSWDEIVKVIGIAQEQLDKMK